MQTTSDTSRQRKEDVIASLLRKPSFEEIDWRFLMKQGVLVHLRIRRCRFTAKLEFSDLGVEVKDARVRQAIARTLVLGEKRLLPETYMTALERIESRARRLLQKCSFTTELGSFLPVSAYGSWKMEVEACRQQYFQLRDEIIDKHASWEEQVLAEYAIVAADTYQRIREASPEALEEGQEEFVAAYCRRVASLIPGPERIRATFDFTFTLGNGVKQLEGDPEELWATAGLPTEQIRIQAGNREYQQVAMERDLLQQEREQKKTIIDSFLANIVAQLRSLIYDVSLDVLSNLQKRKDGKFSRRSVVQLKNLVKQVKLLDFYGDVEVERILTQLQQVIDQSPEARQRSLGEIQQNLRNIATACRSTLLNLEEEPRSAREFAIPDYPSETMVREARTQLGLDLDPEQFLMRFETREARQYSSVGLWNMGDEAMQREARLA
jgi:ElaB/YqjD/DUF883 family membrane-anchored ribosome-binding protein